MVCQALSEVSFLLHMFTVLELFCGMPHRWPDTCCRPVDAVAGGSRVQKHPWLQSNLKASLGYVIHCLKKTHPKIITTKANRHMREHEREICFVLICHEPWKDSFRTWTVFVLHAQTIANHPLGRIVQVEFWLRLFLKWLLRLWKVCVLGGRRGGVCGLRPAPSISPQSHALHLQTYTFFFLFFNDLF